MTKSMQQAHDANEHDDIVTGVTRRTMLAGAAASTVAVTIGVDAPALAQSPPPSPMQLFITLSAALTGIAGEKLSPFADPLDVKRQYFNRASGTADEFQGIQTDEKLAKDFAALLQITKDAKLAVSPSDGIIKQEDAAKLAAQIEQAGDDVKYLARSIILMWYLGSWYKPSDLKPTNINAFIEHEVISPAAYTSGWVWRIAQAHPMGYSDLQFGYWTRQPQPIADFIAVRKPRGARE